MRFLFACFLLALVSNQLFFVNSQIVRLFNVNHFFEIGWKFLAQEKAGSNGVGSDYQPFHYFIGGDGTCSEEVAINENSDDEQLDKAIDSIEDNLSPTYVGASYSNYKATLSFIFTASFNTAVDLEARKDMVGYELQLINNSGKMSCVKIFIKKKYIENAKMKRTITIKLKDIIVSMRKPGFAFFYGSAKMTVLFVKPSGGYFHYKNLTTKLTDVGLKSLTPDVDITELIDRTLCYGQFANFTCVARTGKSPNFYTAVIYPYSFQFNEMKGICRYIYNRKHFNFTVNEFDRIDKNISLYFKLLRTENLDVECGNEFLSPTKDNECVKRNEMGNKYCDCDGTCHECYTYIRGGFWSAIEARINKNRSNPCAFKPNSAFDLDSLIIEEKFNGNRSLDVLRTRYNRRQLEKKHELYVFSIDTLPRPCFTLNATHLKIEMNDVNKQGHSSLYEEQLVEFTLYAVVSSQDPYRKENFKSVRSDFIKPELVQVFQSTDYFDIDYSGRYEIPFKKQAHLNKKFIFQLRMLKSKSMKREKITCIDESDVNNKLNEVDSEYCVKLVGYFQVNESAKIYDTRTCMTQDSAEFRNILLYFSDWRSYGGRLDKLASDFVGVAVVPESFDLEDTFQIIISLVQFYTSDSYWFWVVLAACLLVLILSITYIVIRFCKAFPDKQLVIFISPFININSQDILLKIAKVLKCNMCIFKNYHITIINYGNFWENRHYLDDSHTLVICLNHGLAENQKLLDLDTNTRDESILSLNPLLLTYLSVHKEFNRCIDVTLCENKSDRPLSFNNVPNFSIPFEYPSFVEDVKLRSNYLASVGKNVLITSLANLVFKISSYVKLGQAKSSLNSRVKAYFKQSRQDVESEVEFDYFDLFLSGEYL